MAFAPYYMKNVNLILGDEATGTDFKCQLRSVVLSPDTNIARIKTACPEGQFAEAEDPEWTLDLGYLYGTDSTAADEALAGFLLANVGDKVPFTFRPVAGGAGYSGTVTVVPGPIGGEYGSFSEQSVSLPVEGQPLAIAADATP